MITLSFLGHIDSLTIAVNEQQHLTVSTTDNKDLLVKMSIECLNRLFVLHCSLFILLQSFFVVTERGNEDTGK